MEVLLIAPTCYFHFQNEYIFFIIKLMYHLPAGTNMFNDKPIFTGRHLTANLKSNLHSIPATAISHGSILFVAPISFIYYCFTPFPL